MTEGTQSLSFSFVEETGELHARFDPVGGAALPDLTTFRQKLADAGFGDVYLNEMALIDFMQRCETAEQSLDMVIGERRDVKISLTPANDLMSAYLTLPPGQDPKLVGSAILDALREQGIEYGILQSQIDAALAAGHCEHLLIAKGDMPQEGVATRFETLFESKKNQEISEDDLAVIQLSNLGHLLLVHPGEQLMRRYPPLAGKDGINIKNQVVPPKAIEEEFFGNDLSGAAPDPNDPNLLVATFAGQPVSVGNGVKVNPIVEVAAVDVSTGNIKFEGSIQVVGDVKSGMRLEVTGDVLVKGTVEAAEIVAGGNVTVNGGIIGHADTHSGASHVLPENTARIRCEGKVQARFMENAHVEAGDSILIDQGASQCELMARNEIVVGKPGSKTGKIIGGMAQATNLVRAAVLGSSSGGKTRVYVGSDPYLDEVVLGKKRLLQHKNDELDKVLKLLAYLKQNPKKDPGGLTAKTENTCQLLAREIEALTAELAQFDEKLESIEQAQVEVSNTIHAGAEIHIGKHILQVDDDMRGATIKLQEGVIAICH